MNEYPSSILVKVLYQEFPEIARRVEQKVKEIIPESTLSDLAHVKNIVKIYCCANNLDPSSLINIDKKRSISNHRRILAVTLIKIYQPEVLLNLINRSIGSKLIQSFKNELGLSAKTARQDMRIAKQHYHFYKDFRQCVNDSFNLILEQYGNKENT